MKKFFLSVVFFIISVSFFAENITFSSDSMSGTAGNKSDHTVLNGNAKVTTSSMDISADRIELSGKDFRYISAEGNISGSISESKMEFTCGKLSYDRETKIATLENTVHLIDTENDVIADAQLIEYNQNTSIAVMQISVTLKQKDNTCTSAYAIYKKESQILDMSGNPKIVQGDDIFRAQTIKLDLTTQEITLDGRVQGSITTTKDSNSNTTNMEKGPTAENSESNTEIANPSIESPEPNQDSLTQNDEHSEVLSSEDSTSKAEVKNNE